MLQLVLTRGSHPTPYDVPLPGQSPCVTGQQGLSAPMRPALGLDWALAQKVTLQVRVCLSECFRFEFNPAAAVGAVVCTLNSLDVKLSEL